jgi:prevent-host-death family protein
MAKSVFTTSDLSRKSGDIIAEAMRQPVTITQRNKPRFVLLNVEDYERLKSYADHRTVGSIDSMDDELFEKFEKAVEEYANSDDD